MTMREAVDVLAAHLQAKGGRDTYAGCKAALRAAGVGNPIAQAATMRSAYEGGVATVGKDGTVVLDKAGAK